MTYVGGNFHSPLLCQGVPSSRCQTPLSYQQPSRSSVSHISSVSKLLGWVPKRPHLPTTSLVVEFSPTHEWKICEASKWVKIFPKKIGVKIPKNIWLKPPPSHLHQPLEVFRGANSLLGIQVAKTNGWHFRGTHLVLGCPWNLSSNYLEPFDDAVFEMRTSRKRKKRTKSLGTESGKTFGRHQTKSES